MCVFSCSSRIAFITVALALAQECQAQTPDQIGQWSAVVQLPYKPVSAHLLPTKKVMFWDSFGQADNARLWDPATGAITAAPKSGINIFCTGHSFLADGRLLVTGGHIDNFVGLPYTLIYNPFNNTWTRMADMNAGRWYPTNTTLPSGDVLVVAGQIDTTVGMNTLPQVYVAGTGTWRSLTSAQLALPFYPFMYATSNGRVFCAGPQQTSRYLDTSGTGAWTAVANNNFGARNWGSSVMYAPDKILIAGGTLCDFYSACSPTATAETIDLNSASPSWSYIAPMTYPRKHHNATLLPDGTVLVTGGSMGDEGPTSNSLSPAYAAELWDPATNTWKALASLTVFRGYHSTAFLLPDGRVFSGGGDIGGPSAEIYSPPYLFKGARPAITAVPSGLGYGATFFVSTAEAADISKVTLLALSSVTHGFNESQRINQLAFSVGSGGLNVTAPASANLAPRGYYMLFLINSAGVPSVAEIVGLDASTVPAVPSAPTSLTASSVGTQIDLSWTDNSTNETGFKIERSSTGTASDFAQIGTVSAGITTFSNSGLPAAATFYYRVRATNTGGDSDFSNTANATTSSASAGGLSGQYFDNQDLTNPKFTRVDPAVNFSWASGGSPSPQIAANSFSIRWTGQVRADFSEVYRFYTVSNDGVRLWVNNQQLVNNWTDHAATENSGTIAMQAGQWYPITLEYYQGVGSAQISLSYSSASTSKRIIPPDHLMSNTTPALTVSVSPLAASLSASQTQQFTATVTGSTNTAVTWSLSPTYGTISTSGLYTAPASISTQQTVTVTATSQADSTKSASATLTLTAPTGGVTVVISPASATLTAAQTRQFTATVTGTSNTAVTWSINPIVGTISTSGLYTAPASISTQQTVTVTATSQADSTKSASATVTLTPAVAGGGLSGQYFDNQDLTNPKLTRVDPTVNFSWPSGGSPSPLIAASSFSIRWTGQVRADFTEVYRFYTVSNDGVRLWVNNQQLVNNWTDHAATENSGTIALQAGQWYPITLEYYQGVGSAQISLSYSSASTSKRIIPSDHLLSSTGGP